MDDTIAVQCLETALELTKSYPSAKPPFCPAFLAGEFGVAGIRERLLDCEARLTSETSGLFIEVNSIFPEVRRRLSLAHEIGHLILDRCTGGTHLQNEHHSKEVEALCNRIAALLLAPDWAIREYFENSSVLGNWSDAIRCSTLISAASTFNVSVDAITARVLRELGLIPSTVAVIWRYAENRMNPASGADLRVSSVWQHKRSAFFVPLNKTAPKSGVIRKAWGNSGVCRAEEDLALGSLRGRFLVEAVAFGPVRRNDAGTHNSSVLSLFHALPHSPFLDPPEVCATA